MCYRHYHYHCACEIADYIHERWGSAGSWTVIFVCIALLVLIDLIHCNRWEIKRFFKKMLDKIKNLWYNKFRN